MIDPLVSPDPELTAPRLPEVAPIDAAEQGAIGEPADGGPVAPDSIEALRAAVLGWYSERGRDLAFRGTRDPWAILVSETMAQQTQAARAAEAWRGFMVAYPTPGSLAGAPTGDVLRAWRGLGYNRRAVLLQRAARAIVERHGGTVPSSVEVLETLPGVGPYTARAVAALAFGVPVGAVDTNVRRVLTRLAAGSATGPLSTSALQGLADRVVDPADPGRWTHAVMDLGATRCRAARPRCDGCPALTWCGTAGGGRARATWPGIVPAAKVPRAGTTGSAPAGRSSRVADRQRSGGRASRSSEPTMAFAATTRWLRGRIVDRLRDAPDGSWVPFLDPIGDHEPAAVREAIVGLVRDGLAEAHPDDPAVARLPDGS
jgi:A/G-specific adenine glycosylase